MRDYLYSADWFFHPIVIEEGINDQIVVSRGQEGAFTAVIPAGVYHWLLGWNVPSINSFEEVLWAALDNVGWTLLNGEEGWYFEAPTSSPALGTKAINLAPTVAASPGYGFLVTSPDFTLNPSALGLPADIDSMYPDDHPAKWLTPFGVNGLYKPVTVNKDIFASDKRSNKTHDTTWSTKRARGRRSNTWYKQRVRQFLYQNVRAGHIYPARNLGSQYATVAHLGLGDQGNGWLDVYDALRQELPVYVVHDTPLLPKQGETDIGSGAGSEWLQGKFERLQLVNVAEATSVARTINTVQITGEAYDISVGLVVSQVDDFAIYPQ